MATDPAPPRDPGVLIRMTRPMLDALARAKEITGLDQTNYARQAIWRSLVLDGLAGQSRPPKAAEVVAAIEVVRFNLEPLATEPCANPVIDPADALPDDCYECPSCRARAALATIEIDLLEGALGIKL